VHERLMAGPRDLGLGMDRVAVAREGADFESARSDGVLKDLERGTIGQQLLWTTVPLTGVVAGSDLDAVQSGRQNAIQSGLEWPVAEEDSKYTQLHGVAFTQPVYPAVTTLLYWAPVAPRLEKRSQQDKWARLPALLGSFGPPFFGVKRGIYGHLEHDRPQTERRRL
jgi:hypothetical protein